MAKFSVSPTLHFVTASLEQSVTFKGYMQHSGLRIRDQKQAWTEESTLCKTQTKE